MKHTPTALFIGTVLSILCISGNLFAATIRFIPLNDEIAACKLAVKDSKGLTNLKPLSAQKRSAPYNFKTGEKPLQLVVPDRKDPEGKSAAIEISLPADVKSPLILILLDPQHATGLRLITIEDSAKEFSWGCLRFYNLTEEPLMLRFGAEQKLLPAGNTPLDVLPEGNAHNVGVQLFKEAAPTEILYSAVWEHDPNFRKLIALTNGTDQEADTLDVQILSEDKRIKK
jgi:hypothetical protein